jgi:ferredoxin-NADP reductase
MPATWYDGKIIEIKNLSTDVREFTVEIGDISTFDFLPGQFVTMDLPVSEKRLHRWKSYSIANAPNGSNKLQFCVVRLEGGAGTTYLFEQAGLGTILKFKGPDGGFVIPEDLSRKMVMICTGTGVAPFRSMLNYIRDKHLDFTEIHLIFGTRYESGILYKDEFEKMAAEISGFKYSVALSRESKPPHYEGYVHQIYMNEYNNKDSDTRFYICGWSKMIDEAVANLIIKCGYDRSQVHYELYG